MHPDRAMAFVCRRCGAFGCETCRALPRDLVCRACSKRGEAERAEPITAGSVLSEAFRLPALHPGAVAMYLVVSVLPSALWNTVCDLVFPDFPTASLEAWAQSADHDFQRLAELIASNAPRVGAAVAVALVGWVAWLVATGALTLVVAGTDTGRPISWGAALVASVRRLGALVGANAMVTLAMFAGLLLCIVPGVVCAILGSLVDPAVVIGRNGPLGAVAVSARLSVRAVGPIVLLVLVTLSASLVISWPVSAASGLLPDHLVLQRALDVFAEMAGRLCAVPLIAGVARLYLRLEGSPPPENNG